MAPNAVDWHPIPPDLRRPRARHAIGGYQTWRGLRTYLEPGTGEAIVAESAKLLERLRFLRHP